MPVQLLSVADALSSLYDDGVEAVEWQLDGVSALDNNDTDMDFLFAADEIGSHHLSAIVQDHTGIIRKDLNIRATQVLSWNIEVTP